MEKFNNLPIEKQNTIINAAFKEFGNNGYKKTSIRDIALSAGISKAMIFHYFGTKKALYLHLITLCGELVMNEINSKFDYTVTDFFDRIKLSTEIEISILKRYPHATSFLTSMYFEEDAEVKDDIQTLLAQGESFRNKISSDNIDYSKFKESVDIATLMKMFSWIGDGYAKQLSNKSDIDYDAILKEFTECLDLLRSNFYKGEYL